MAHYHLIMAALMAASYIRNEQPSIDASSDIGEWNTFKLAHGKSYPNKEIDSLRKFIFLANKLKVEKFNTQSDDLKLSINHLSDLTEEEVKVMRGFKLNKSALTLKGSSSGLNNDKAQAFVDEILNDDTPVPDELDWRKVPGRVSPVKDQGQCRSCWAFASVGALEGQEVLRNKSNMIELSEQNLVDCVGDGCEGGIMTDAFDFVANGIEDEIAYPYTGEQGKCRYDKKKVAFQDSGHAILKSGDEEMLKKVVAKFGPVSVAIDAGIYAFTHYSGGVLSDLKCKNDLQELNHAVLVVGYGTDEKTKKDYWIVKNSWSQDWGEAGYVRMARNADNKCGVATFPVIPIFQKGAI